MYIKTPTESENYPILKNHPQTSAKLPEISWPLFDP